MIKSKLKILKKIVGDPLFGMFILWYKLSPMIKNDELYIKVRYYLLMHKKLNISNPQTYNEKISWLKLNNKDVRLTEYVDKYTAKKHAADRIGSEFIIKTLGVWDCFGDIDFSLLPDKFVLKCTHDSGGIIIVKNKNDLNIKEANKTLSKCLKSPFFSGNREYPYLGVKPRIIAEDLLENCEEGIRDYKFFCFDGVVKFLYVVTGRYVDTRFDFFDRNYNSLSVSQVYPRSEKIPNKPKNYDKMLQLAEKLSKDFKHVRIDLYNIDGNIYFGEYTFFPASGDCPFVPNNWDYTFGEMLNIDVK